MRITLEDRLFDLLDEVNNCDAVTYFNAKEQLSEDVVLGICDSHRLYGTKYPSERYVLNMFLIKRDERYVAVVLENEAHLYMYLDESYQNKGVLHRALSKNILPYLIGAVGRKRAFKVRYSDIELFQFKEEYLKMLKLIGFEEDTEKDKDWFRLEQFNMDKELTN